MDAHLEVLTGVLVISWSLKMRRSSAASLRLSVWSQRRTSPCSETSTCQSDFRAITATKTTIPTNPVGSPDLLVRITFFQSMIYIVFCTYVDFWLASWALWVVRGLQRSKTVAGGQFNFGRDFHSPIVKEQWVTWLHSQAGSCLRTYASLDRWPCGIGREAHTYSLERTLQIKSPAIRAVVSFVNRCGVNRSCRCAWGEVFQTGRDKLLHLPLSAHLQRWSRSWTTGSGRRSSPLCRDPDPPQRGLWRWAPTWRRQHRRISTFLFIRPPRSTRGWWWWRVRSVSRCLSAGYCFTWCQRGEQWAGWLPLKLREEIIKGDWPWMAIPVREKL